MLFSVFLLLYACVLQPKKCKHSVHVFLFLQIPTFSLCLFYLKFRLLLFCNNLTILR